MASKYRIGVIGHTGRGNYGHGLDRVWLEVPDCQIVAVADADKKGLAEARARLKAPKGYADFRHMLDEQKPDIVSIGPRWLDQHRDMVVAVAERGIHIYLEKPLCRTLAEADQMIAACERNHVKLAIAFQTRYSPKLQVVRDLIYDGKIGNVIELRGRGKEDRRSGGEDLWVLGSHVMNLIHYFGGEAKWCFAKVLQDGEPVGRDDVRPGKEGIGPLAGNTVNAMYGLGESMTAYFGSHDKSEEGGRGRFGLRILGTKGVIEILTGYLPAVHLLADPLWSPGRSGAKWLPVSSAGLNQPEPLQHVDNHDGNVAACRDLIAAIEQDRQPEASIYEARTSMEMIAAVFDSHRVGGPVTLPLNNRNNPLTMLPA